MREIAMSPRVSNVVYKAVRVLGLGPYVFVAVLQSMAKTRFRRGAGPPPRSPIQFATARFNRTDRENCPLGRWDREDRQALSRAVSRPNVFCRCAMRLPHRTPTVGVAFRCLVVLAVGLADSGGRLGLALVDDLTPAARWRRHSHARRPNLWPAPTAFPQHWPRPRAMIRCSWEEGD